MKNVSDKYWIGREVIMIEANVEPKKDTFGEIIEYLPKFKICDYIKVKWENGLINKVPAHWISTFSCDDKD